MTTGPVQLIMLGFDDPKFTGEIKAELARLADSDVVRLVDAIVIQKDAEGNVTLIEDDDTPGADAGTIAALIGLAETEATVLDAAHAAAAGEADATVPAGVAAGAGATWTVDDVVPEGMAAAIALVEHRWAIGLRDAIERAGGTLLTDAWIHRDDLQLIGAIENGAIS